MKYALASAASISVVAALLVVGGASDWSHAFAVCWYGLFAAAFVLGLAGLFDAKSSATQRQRVLAIALSLPALAAVPVFLWLVYSFVHNAN